MTNRGSEPAYPVELAPHELRAWINGSSRVDVIKMIRARTGASLKEALDVVTRWSDLANTMRNKPESTDRLRIASEQMAGLLGNKEIIESYSEIRDEVLLKQVATGALLAADALLAAEEESR